MNSANQAVRDAKIAKIRDGMAFLSPRIRRAPSPKALEKSRKLPPFLIRCF